MPTFEHLSTSAILLGILIAAVFVVLSGVKLTRYGDALGERLDLSRTWVGVIVLAMMTSLPELVVTVSAQLAAHRPSLVIGNVCGSNLFNLWIFALIDLLEGPGALSLRVSSRLVRPAFMGILVMLAAFIGMITHPTGETSESWILRMWPSALVFGLACWMMLKLDKSQDRPEEFEGMEELPAPPEIVYGMSLRKILLVFSIFAAVLVVSGVALIQLSDELLERDIAIGSIVFRVDESIIGSILLAMITSLPELVVCIAAVRIGAADMALGNVLGSNVFNMTLLPVAHVLRPGAAFWSQHDPVHLVILIVGMLLSGVIIFGVRLRSTHSQWRLGWDGLVIAIVATLTFIYVAQAGLQF